MRSHFHDNSHWGRFPSDVATLFAAVYGDGLARWLGTAFAASDDDPEAAQAEREGGRGEGESWQSRLFLQKSGAGSEAGSGSGSAVGAGSGSGLALKLPPAKTPAALGLPRVAAFDSGDNFIRSGWEDNGVVLALNNAGPTKTRYTHHHACRNSFVLAAHGEYLVVSPGSFSYRSPKHLTYDLSTRAQNTVEIDGKSQLLPGGGKARHAMNGQPVAKTTLAVEGRAVDVLASDATGAYGQPHKRIARVVIYARGGREGREGREAGYFVIFDRLEEPADGAAHSYAWRLHFNNRDGAALFSRANGGASAAAGATRGEGGEAWFLCRPKAGLEIVVGNENGNGTELDTSVGEAYMHGRGRDYAPGGANEGKPGSAIEFTVRNREKSAGMDFVAVLRPVAGTTADDTPVPLPVVLPVMLPVVLADGKVRVGDDVFTLRGNTLASTVGGVTEQFTVWPQRQP
ncbi:MAG: heparinase II/III-family protein [Opitutaceae bacterium]|nr:heparinase II/III-family protein [Opitutaceae bacterium]